MTPKRESGGTFSDLPEWVQRDAIKAAEEDEPQPVIPEPEPEPMTARDAIAFLGQQDLSATLKFVGVGGTYDVTRQDILASHGHVWLCAEGGGESCLRFAEECLSYEEARNVR